MQPQNCPGRGVFLSVNVPEVIKYADRYGAGIYVVTTPVVTIELLLSRGQIIIDYSMPGAFSVLPAGIPLYNSSSVKKLVNTSSAEYYDLWSQ